MKGRTSERRLICEFVNHLAQLRGCPLAVTSWPEDSNFRTPEIDATAEGSGSRVAIEHTSIDTLPDQRKDDSAFVGLVKAIQEALAGTVAGCVTIKLPAYAQWDRAEQLLPPWLQTALPTLPHSFGRHDVPGLPYQVLIEKRQSNSPRVVVARPDPEDGTLHERLRPLMGIKVAKLVPYRERGFDTILLIENSDIALMNTEKMYHAVNAVITDTEERVLDEVWYADTSIPASVRLWLLWPRNRRVEIYGPDED